MSSSLLLLFAGIAFTWRSEGDSSCVRQTPPKCYSPTWPVHYPVEQYISRVFLYWSVGWYTRIHWQLKLRQPLHRYIWRVALRRLVPWFSQPAQAGFARVAAISIAALARQCAT